MINEFQYIDEFYEEYKCEEDSKSSMIQKEFEMIGKYGCYLLCLLKTANVEEDVYKYYRLFLKNKWIDEECTILKPVDIMKCLSGKTYRVVKSTTLDKSASFYVEYWYNPKTSLHHFTLPNWDSLGESKTKKEGKIESYRLYYTK